MTCLEHYFENLLYGKIKDDPNEEQLTEEQRETAKVCADYVLYKLYINRADFLEEHDISNKH